MLSIQNLAIVKIPFCLKVMPFLIIAYFLFSWERGFLIGNICTVDSLTLNHEQAISGEEMHTLITFI